MSKCFGIGYSNVVIYEECLDLELFQQNKLNVQCNLHVKLTLFIREQLVFRSVV